MQCYRSLLLILSRTGVEFTPVRHMLSCKKPVNYAISYNFEVYKEMSHNLEQLSFQKMCGL